MIILGSPQLDLMIRKFDGITYQGITYRFVRRAGIQALFDHDGPDDEAAIGVAKMVYHSDPELKHYMNTALDGKYFLG